MKRFYNWFKSLFLSRKEKEESKAKEEKNKVLASKLEHLKKTFPTDISNPVK